MPLETYRKMRDFGATPEPAGGTAEPNPARPRFVVQEHHATALHWDFRLEKDGVLVSWAVPRGVPPDPKVNHLAVQTEDHPLEYGDFEGVIPEKQYGAGNVTIWDRGTYELHKWWENEVQFTLHGERVQGKYVLFRTDGKNWMLHRMDPPQDPDREPMPEAIDPMLARPGTLPADDSRWAFEVKWDGVRAIGFVRGGRIRIQSRNLLDTTKQFPELADLGETLGSTEVVLDGEIIATDDAGRPSFEKLQNRLGVARPADVQRRMREVPVVYMIFDLLYLDGHSTQHLPYEERRKLLDGLNLDGPAWKVPPAHVGAGAAMLAASREQGLEGIIAKRLDAPYQPGQRSGAWLKVKNTLRQEFVIGGWTPGTGSREKSVGALLVGYYDRTREAAADAGEPQRFILAGRVGTGFTDAFLRGLMPRLQRLQLDHSPFDLGQPEPGSVFVEPLLVADIDFTQFTEAGTLRHPSFKGLRDDKHPRDVVLETVTPVSELPEVEMKISPRRRGAASGGAVRAADATKVVVNVEGRELALSNLEKVLYPSGFTKAQVIDYYTRIAPVMLPHIRGRAMTRKRYPDGSVGQFFFEKDAPSHTPAWVKTVAIHSRHNDGPVKYILVDDLPTLAWLANLAALELHPSLAVSSDISRPTSVVFDLDPGPPAGIIECCEIALELRDLFEPFGLQAFAKTSGSKGMQVYLPLNTPVTYDETKPFANAVARLLERRFPKKVVSSMSKSVRSGKVLVDWSQNDEHKTTIAVYSLRARERPFVSTPVTWDEVADAANSRNTALLAFEAPEVLDRVARLGDLFAAMETLEQTLPALG